MEYNEVWAVPVLHAEEFFRQNSAVQRGEQDNRSKYLYKNCLITIEKLPGKGILNIPQTRVVMSGQDNDTGEIHEKFFLNFLSAGG